MRFFDFYNKLFVLITILEPKYFLELYFNAKVAKTMMMNHKISVFLNISTQIFD